MMNSIFEKMLAASFFLIGCALSCSAQQKVSVYDGAATLPTGWKFFYWRGDEAALDTSSKMPGQAASIRVGAKNEEVQGYAGGGIMVRDKNAIAKSAIKFDASKWANLYLNILINGGTNLQGTYEGGQPLQIEAVFTDSNGGIIQGGYVPIKQYLEDASIDKDPNTWQQISIPLSVLKIPEAKRSAITGIEAVYFQFIGLTPIVSSINVSSISVGGSIPKVTSENQSDKIDVPAADATLFPAFNQLKSPFLTPPNPKFTIDQYGNFVLNGKPHFIIGAQMEEKIHSSFAPTPGYPDTLKWIYEQPLNYENAQRLGMDSIGMFTLPRWVLSIDPSKTRIMEQNGEMYFNRFIQGSHLPLYVDFTCFPWTQGILYSSKKIPDEAKNTRGPSSDSNHWVPYAILDPEGRKLYQKMFADGAKQIVDNKGEVLFYELFNEPGYNDPSPYNREKFAEAMKLKYGDIKNLNDLWHTRYTDYDALKNFKSRADNPALFVEWSQFLEDAFTDVVKIGIQTIDSIDHSHSNFTVQIAGGDRYRVLPNSNVNLYKLSKYFSVLSTMTDGGIEAPGSGGLTAPPAHSIDVPYFSQRFDGLVGRSFLRSIGRNKAITDDEAYVNGRDISDALWLELARGGNASYLFEWSKRGWDSKYWGNPPVPQGGKKLAAAMNYFLLNPYATAPNKLSEIVRAKKEILSLSDLFVPRQNRSKPQIAVLLSYPTERYSQAVGTLEHHQIRNYTVALDFSQYDSDVILEEQLPQNRLDEYKVLVAPGDENIQNDTAPIVESWVKKGGTLILGLEAMQEDEIGNSQQESTFLNLKLGDRLQTEEAPLSGIALCAPWLPGEILGRPYKKVLSSAGWETLAKIGNYPAILSRTLGKGHIYFINAKIPDYALSSILGGILQKASIPRLAALSRLDNNELQTNIELCKFTNSPEKLTGYFLYNWDNYPKAFRFKVPELSDADVELLDPLRKETFEIKNGEATVWIPAEGKRILVIAKRNYLQQRFGRGQQITSADVTRMVADAQKQQVKAEPVKAALDYKVDSTKMQTIDLRPFVNRDFVDSVAGDGKGGWTDQGENSLHDVEWGHQTYLGVPFDIIRPDMNGGKGALVLGSKHLSNVPMEVKGIPIEGDVKTLFFLHTTAWTVTKQEAFRYIVHYADGSQITIPIRGGIETGDWWISGTRDLTCKVAWKNTANQGFYIYQWKNPNPQKSITQLDIVSSDNSAIPIIIGISAEMN